MGRGLTETVRVGEMGKVERLRKYRPRRDIVSRVGHSYSVRKLTETHHFRKYTSWPPYRLFINTSMHANSVFLAPPPPSPSFQYFLESFASRRSPRGSLHDRLCSVSPLGAESRGMYKQLQIGPAIVKIDLSILIDWILQTQRIYHTHAKVVFYSVSCHGIE